MIAPPSLERVLIVAPHPDDESVASGGLIQRASAARVVVATDGERNLFPQLAMMRKLKITNADRVSWGTMRRKETLAALDVLGVNDARFLGFPDQSLLQLARHDDHEIRTAIAAEIRAYRPTLIVSPSAFDLHADHRALAWFVHGVSEDLPIITALVHGSPPEARLAFALSLTEEERRRKKDAIACHASQLALSRRRFLRYARPTETYLIAEHDIVAREIRRAGWLRSLKRGIRVAASFF